MKIYSAEPKVYSEKRNYKKLIWVVVAVFAVAFVACTISVIIALKNKKEIYSANYTVVFQNDDGTIISKNLFYHYGDIVQVPESPTKESDETYIYTFVGYDKNIQSVTGNIIYTAVYSKTYKNYSIVFKNSNDIVITQKDNYHYGDIVSVPTEVPTRADENGVKFVFVDWDTTVSQVDGDKTYTASYLHYNLTGEGEDAYYVVQTMDKCESTTINILDNINGTPVKKIGSEAFKNNKFVTNITIPFGITKIGANAFDNCTNLEFITLPETLEEISSHAFFYCTKLDNITLPSTLKLIKNNAFSNCQALSKISIPSSVEEIEKCAFEYCSKMKEINFEENSKLTIFNEYLFYNCESLTKLKVPSGVTKFDRFSLASLTSLETIYIPSTVTSSVNDVFDSSSNLKTVYYEGEIQDWLNITFSTYNPYTNPMAYASNFFIKNGEGNYTELRQLVIPEGVTKIKARAFNGFNNLTSITLPSTLKNINANAFLGCDEITTVYYEGSEEDWSLVKINNSGNDSVKNAEKVFSLTNEESRMKKTLAEAKTAYTLILAEDLGEDGHYDNVATGTTTAVEAAGYTTEAGDDVTYIVSYETDGTSCTAFVFHHSSGYTATLNVLTGEWAVA